MKKEIEEYIRSAIDNDSLCINYQPQFCYQSGQIKLTGVEALINPDTSVCHIDLLFKVAIESRLVYELGYYIIRRAANQLREWCDQNIVTSAFTMSVNVHPAQLQDNQFCSQVLDIIEEAEINPHQMVLELTEYAMIDDNNVAKIYQLANSGVPISLDDFGTGYSSLSRLKFLPISEIKIDKVFVDDITETDNDLALITAMYLLTSALKKHTMVEGVETKKQFEILQEIGFTCFQGFFFSKPVTASEVHEMIMLVNSLHCQ